jgi:hypothetical protein
VTLSFNDKFACDCTGTTNSPDAEILKLRYAIWRPMLKVIYFQGVEN